MPSFDPKLSSRGVVGSQIVGDQPLRNEGIPLQELAHQFQRGALVAFGLNQHVEDLTPGPFSSLTFNGTGAIPNGGNV